jgi:4-hydroxy-3-methylbut-2-enyl diphosphate reductase
VGDPKSSNSNRLREVAERRGQVSYLINCPEEIDPNWLKNVSVIAMTAGASTPESIVQKCIEKLRTLGVNKVEEVTFINEDVFFQLPKQVLV